VKAREFQKFIDHYGLITNFPWGALARLGITRVGSRASVILTAPLFWQFHAVLLPWQVLGVPVWAVLASW